MERKDDKKETIKTFDHSDLLLKDRTKLQISGLEKAYELSENRLLLKVSGNNLVVCGENLNVVKLEVESGLIEVEGLVSEIKYSSSMPKGNFFKRIFK